MLGPKNFIFSKSMPYIAFVPKKIDAYFLGIAIVLSGQYYSWNFGLAFGFWNFFVAILTIFIGYSCYLPCLAEMTSMLPMPGGTYGIVRVTFGSYLGFLVGCFEAFLNIFVFSQTILPLGSLCTAMFHTSIDNEPWYWCIIIIFPVICCCCGGQLFWRPISIIGFVSIVILVMYVLISFRFVNFSEYATDHDVIQPSSDSAFINFFTVLPLAMWPFAGLEFLPVCSGLVSEPRITVPSSMLAVMVSLTILIVFLVFCVSSQPPGLPDISNMFLPLNSAFSRAFQITDLQASILSIPGIYGSAFGSLWVAGQVLTQLSLSRFLPQFLSRNFYCSADVESNVNAVVCSALIAVALMLGIAYGLPDISYFLINCISLMLCFVDLIMCISFIVFRYKFGMLERQYRTPVGSMGACIGAFVFLLIIIGIIGMQPGSAYVVVSVVGFAILLTFYYYFVASKQMFFSPAEQHIMLNVYVMKARLMRNLPEGAHSQSTTTSAFSSLDTASIFVAKIAPQENSFCRVDYEDPQRSTFVQEFLSVSEDL